MILGISAILFYRTTNTTTFQIGKASEITPLSSLSLTPTKEELKRASVYLETNMGLKDFVNTITCESNFKYDAFNKLGNSFGVLQFIPSTFKQYCMGDYNSPHDQLLCGSVMFKSGLAYHWDCYCLAHSENKDCKRRGF